MEGSTEYIIDDTPVHIPEEVRAMPTEQLDAEIRQLEMEAQEERRRIREKTPF